MNSEKADYLALCERIFVRRLEEARKKEITNQEGKDKEKKTKQNEQ